MNDDTISTRARQLAARLEPVVGQVYFSPECHTAYVGLGFGPSPGDFNGVAAPDGPAYFTSRGSLMGQVAPHVVSCAFGVFNPAVVVPGVAFGWSITDADTIFAARRQGAVAQLERILGPADSAVERAGELLHRAVEPLREPGRPLFAGLRSRWDDPSGWTRVFHLGDMLREFRGDAHVAAWTSAGLDAVEIGLMTECFIGLPMRTYIRTRAWDDEALDAATERLRSRGWVGDDTLTASGFAVRDDIERTTDRALLPALAALGDGVTEVCTLLEPWGVAIRRAGGYIGGPVDLWPTNRR